MSSRAKGKRGELEAAKALAAALRCAVERNAQYCGKAGDADLSIEALPGLHVEVKRRGEPVTPHHAEEFIRQAERDAGAVQGLPIVIHRSDGDTEWMVSLRLANLERLHIMLAHHQAWHEPVPYEVP